MPLTQENRQIKLGTPLGPDALLVTAFSGREEMSKLFQFTLEMISEQPDIKHHDIVGKNVTVSIERSDGSLRYFNGFVSRFSAGDEEQGRRNFRAEIVPWLWFLTRTADCRIFQKLKVPDIVKQIFDEAGFSDYKFNLKQDHSEWEYCVQYRESDFQFVSRLMEQEGIFYYFKHENGKHTMVISDHKSGYYDGDEKQVDFPATVGEKAIKDHITSWQHEYEYATGKWAQSDYNFETPSTSLLTQIGSVIKISDNDKYEIFDYPGDYANKAEGEGGARIRMEELEAATDVVQGSSFCKTFSPGGKFAVGIHHSPGEEGKKYVLTAVAHEARELLAYETGSTGGEGISYRNTFRCIPEAVVFRPPRQTPKPVIHGLQTAIVVGPASEEIFVDKYGRVKVHFHWDRLGKHDENDSCWIRVSQTNAEKGFGAMHIPRVGAEVVVSFIEGDPDQPLIVGRVYHAENMPPYGLPDSKTVSGIKSKTYKGGGYNELIMDDSKDKELLRIHAQKDMSTKVLHNQDTTVLNDRTVTVMGKLTETITKDTKITIETGKYEHKVATGKASYHVQGALDETYASTQTTKVAGTIDYSSAADIKITAADKIVIAVGSSSLTMDKSGNIDLIGVKIKINGSEIVQCEGAKVHAIGGTETKMAVASQTVTCDASKVAVAGAAINSSAMGVHEITGALVKIN
jgi:type VI secretion system secreted protein VgrG